MSRLHETVITINNEAEEPLVYFIEDVLSIDKFSVEDPETGEISVKIYSKEDDDRSWLKELDYFIKELPGNGIRVRNYTIKENLLEDTDWLYKWREYFKPIRVSENFQIIPSWEKESVADEDGLKLYLNPKMGFGTGQHPTTFLCLKELCEEDVTGKNILDVGAGSGILGTAALMMDAKRADLVEIDDMAVESCRETLELNGVKGSAEVYLADILKSTEPFSGRTYDLAFINIIAEVVSQVLLLDFIQKIPVIYLSGIIEEKKQLIVDTVKKIGYVIEKEQQMNEWLFFKIKKQGENHD